jgi:hypothetical protein
MYRVKLFNIDKFHKGIVMSSYPLHTLAEAHAVAGMMYRDYQRLASDYDENITVTTPMHKITVKDIKAGNNILCAMTRHNVELYNKNQKWDTFHTLEIIKS